MSSLKAWVANWGHGFKKTLDAENLVILASAAPNILKVCIFWVPQLYGGAIRNHWSTPLNLVTVLIETYHNKPAWFEHDFNSLYPSQQNTCFIGPLFLLLGNIKCYAVKIKEFFKSPSESDSVLNTSATLLIMVWRPNLHFLAASLFIHLA